MSVHDPLIGVSAHQLLNSAAAVQGLMMTARALLREEPDASAIGEAIALMGAAEAKAAAMVERLRYLALGGQGSLEADEP